MDKSLQNIQKNSAEIMMLMPVKIKLFPKYIDKNDTI